MWRTAMGTRMVICGAGLFVSALAAGLLFARQAPESYDAQVMVQVTRSMVDHHDFLVRQDAFGMNSPYSIYGIGMPALMTAPYWLAERLGSDPLPWMMSVNAVILAVIA